MGRLAALTYKKNTLNKYSCNNMLFHFLSFSRRITYYCIFSRNLCFLGKTNRPGKMYHKIRISRHVDFLKDHSLIMVFNSVINVLFRFLICCYFDNVELVSMLAQFNICKLFYNCEFGSRVRIFMFGHILDHFF